LTACFLPNLPALFHAGSARGVLPLQGLSPSRSLRALSDAGAFMGFAANRATFKALLPVRIRHLPQWGEPSREAAALLGFPLSREFLPGTACGVCRRSPQELRRGPKLRNPCGPLHSCHELLYRVLTTPGPAWPLSRLPPLLSFLHLVSEPPVEGAVMPGLWIHPAR